MDAIKEEHAISLADIDMDASAAHCQIRGCTDSAVVEEYAGQMLDSVEFPPIHIFTDGSTNWLVDGFHRVEAAADAGLEELPCILHEGTLRDAILYAVGANAEHGLRRTNADKRAAVLTLLNDDAWCKWSDRKIARQCGVSNPFVSQLRKSICEPLTDSPKQVERNGTTYEMQTANIGAKPNVNYQDARPPVDEPSGVPGELGDEWSVENDGEDFETYQSFPDLLPPADDPEEDDEPPVNKFGAFYDLISREADKILAGAAPHEYFVLASQLHAIAEDIEAKGQAQ